MESESVVRNGKRKEERGEKSYLVFIESLRNHNENLGRG